MGTPEQHKISVWGKKGNKGKLKDRRSRTTKNGNNMDRHKGREHTSREPLKLELHKDITA